MDSGSDLEFDYTDVAASAEIGDYMYLASLSTSLIVNTKMTAKMIYREEMGIHNGKKSII